MRTSEGPAAAEQKPVVEQSPTEKLRENERVASPVPGTQNPESEEIKREINPNTE